MIYEEKHVWSVLLRLYHWFLVIAMIALTVTGFYINAPWTQTTLEGRGLYPMLTMRNIHGLAAYLFTAAILVRVYLLLFGNRQERIMSMLPLNRRNLRNMMNAVRAYFYLHDDYTEVRLGHNILAGTTYVMTLILALYQIASGFYLRLPENTFWQNWGGMLFGNQQQARFTHHLVMWYFIIFTLVHLYLVIWNELKHRDGLISSILSGNKFRPRGME